MTEFLDRLAAEDPPLTRVPGVAVYLHPTKETAPLALRIEVENTCTFPQRVLIVSVDQVSIPQVKDFERFHGREIGDEFRVTHVTIRTGYHDPIDVPAALRLCRKQGLLEKNLDLEHASYIVSRIAIKPTRWPADEALAQKAVRRDGPERDEPDRRLPAASERTVIVGSQIPL